MHRSSDKRIWFPTFAIQPNTMRLAIAASNCDIELWDGQFGVHIQTFLKSGETSSLAFLPGDAYLASGCRNGIIRLWNIVTGMQIQTFEGHSLDINCLSASQSKPQLVSASDDGTVRVWDTEKAKCLFTLKSHYRVLSVAFLADETRLIAGTQDGHFQLWDITTGAEIWSYRLSSYKEGIVMSSDGKWLAAPSIYENVAIFDVTHLDTMKFDDPAFTLKTGVINSISLSPDGKHLVSCSSSTGVVSWWDVQSGECLRNLNHTVVRSAAFSSNGTYIVSGIAILQYTLI